MNIYEIILSAIATLNPPDASPDVKAKIKPNPDHYFCCDWVDPNGNDGAGTGGGCVKTSEDNVNGCSHWLACPGGATGSDGVVTCTAPKKTEKLALQHEPDDEPDAAFCCDEVEIVDGYPRGYGCSEVIADTEAERLEILNSAECPRSIGCDGNNFTNDNGTVTCR